MFILAFGHATDMNVHPAFDRFGIAAKTRRIDNMF